MSKPPFSLTGFDHVVYLIDDMPRALQFYQAVLGCVPGYSYPALGMEQLWCGACLIVLWDTTHAGAASARPPVAGGRNVRCAPYAVFGSQLLSDHAIEALQNRRACLLANHGLIATGHDLTQAINLAEEIEALCQQYMHVKQMGEPVLLSDAEMDAVMQQFKGYGNWTK